MLLGCYPQHKGQQGHGMPSRQNVAACLDASLWALGWTLGVGGGGTGIPHNSPFLAVDILDAVRQSIQKYEALYIGSLPVPRAMGKCCWPCSS